ncbi:unnamed protein product [Allacma fusca]|uniref:Uncharacterized protein n=1 Tax=Allacma fusca TaxID=39272 RepID=A0A8J2JAB6_9HEXA|nr:unnamed protein product [Allacma fusca]
MKSGALIGFEPIGKRITTRPRNYLLGNNGGRFLRAQVWHRSKIEGEQIIVGGFDKSSSLGYDSPRLKENKKDTMKPSRVVLIQFTENPVIQVLLQYR